MMLPRTIRRRGRRRATAASLLLPLLATLAASAALTGSVAAAATFPSDVYIGVTMPLDPPDLRLLFAGIDLAYMAVADINNDTALLPNSTVHLIVNSSGSSATWGLADRAVGAAYYQMVSPDNPHHVQALVLDVSHANAAPQSLLATHLKVPAVSISQDSPEIATSPHRYTMRLTGNAMDAAPAFISLMRDMFQWRRAILLSETTLHVSVLDKIVSLGRPLGYEFEVVLVSPTDADAITNALASIQRSTIRIVYVYMATLIEKFLAALKAQGLLTNSGYTFVGSSWCTFPTMDVADPPLDATGMVCLHEQKPTGTKLLEWSQRAVKRTAQVQAGVVLFTSFQTAMYNSFFVIARAMHTLWQKYDGVDTAPLAGSKLRAAMLNTSYDAVGGSIQFDSNGDIVNQWEVSWFNSKSAHPLWTGKWERVATYSKITKQFGASVATPIWGDGTTTVPSDSPKNIIDSVHPTLFMVGWVMMGAAQLICIVLAFMVVQHRRHPLIRASSPSMMAIMLFGCVVTMTGIGLGAFDKDSDWVCSSLTGTISMGFWIMLVPLLLKTWRLHKIFNGSHLSIQVVSNKLLFGIMTCILAVEAVLLTLYNVVGGLEGHAHASRTGAFHVTNVCHVHDPMLWYVVLVGPKVVTLLLLARLAYHVRNLEDAFNESRMIAYACYTLFIMGMLGGTVHIVLESDVNIAYSALIMSLLMGAMSVAVILVVPKLMVVRGRLSYANADASSSGRGGRNKSGYKGTSIVPVGGARSVAPGEHDDDDGLSRDVMERQVTGDVFGHTTGWTRQMTGGQKPADAQSVGSSVHRSPNGRARRRESEAKANSAATSDTATREEVLEMLKLRDGQSVGVIAPSESSVSRPGRSQFGADLGRRAAARSSRLGSAMSPQHNSRGLSGRQAGRRQSRRVSSNRSPGSGPMSGLAHVQRRGQQDASDLSATVDSSTPDDADMGAQDQSERSAVTFPSVLPAAATAKAGENSRARHASQHHHLVVRTRHAEDEEAADDEDGDTASSRGAADNIVSLQRPSVNEPSALGSPVLRTLPPLGIMNEED